MSLLVSNIFNPDPHQMKLATALLVVIWWICVWGLSDLLTEHWTRRQKLIAYAGGAIAVIAITVFFPTLLDRL